MSTAQPTPSDDDALARQLAAQLRQPRGAQARETAASMNRANRETNRRAIKLLRLEAHDRVLEIGPGNGAFAAQIVSAAAHIAYTGLDWSHDMVLQAQRRNHRLAALYPVVFEHGNAQHMPFGDQTFDKILAVHTVYFWDDPVRQLHELQRVLNPDGLMCLAFGDRSFMQQLTFTRHGFTLHDAASMTQLLHSQGWRLSSHRRHQETGLSNTGQMVKKTIHVMACRPPTQRHGTQHAAAHTRPGSC